MSGVFITATDTNIGKTFISAVLINYYLRKNKVNNIAYFKPIQTGSDSDSDTVAKLTKIDSNKIIKPVYNFAAPIAANRAARLEGKTIDFNIIKEYYNKINSSHIIVEGAGGLLSPAGEKKTFRDLAKLLNLPLIIVASTRLGTINHTLLTIEAALKDNLIIKGVILNGVEDAGLAETITEFSNVKILGCIKYFETINHSILKNYEFDLNLSKIFYE